MLSAYADSGGNSLRSVRMTLPLIVAPRATASAPGDEACDLHRDAQLAIDLERVMQT